MAGVLYEDKYTCCRSKEEYERTIKEIPDAWMVGHNLPFDLKFLVVHGWITSIPNNIHDTQLMAHVCTRKVSDGFLERYEEERKRRNAELPRGVSHRQARALSLKVLAPYFLKVPWFWENPYDHNDEGYNKKDCLYTKGLFLYLWERLEENGLEFYINKMLPWSKMLTNMTLRGISIDLNKLSQIEDDYIKATGILEGKLDAAWADAHREYKKTLYYILNEKYGDMARRQVAKGKDPLKTATKYNILLLKAAEKLSDKINYSSPPQMKWLLRDYLKLDITKIDSVDEDEDPESTGKAVLHKLANEGRDDIALFLEWRQSSKILTAFLPTYKELNVDGIIHPDFKLTGTRTGRTSSANPNMQQVPPKLYSLFAPRAGMDFIQYDLSGIEAALIALYSSDKTLYDILASGASIHDYNAKVLFEFTEPVEQIKTLYPKQRQTVKNVGFACFYGAGSNRIKTVFQSAGFTLTDVEAKSKLRRLKNAYPEVFKFHKEITEAFENGDVVDNLLGRPIFIPDPRQAYMKGFNTLIQSSASDLNLHACNKAELTWKQMGIEANPLLVIHDCIIAESKKGQAETAARILVDKMTNYDLQCKHGKIDLKVEGGVSNEWRK